MSQGAETTSAPTPSPELAAALAAARAADPIIRRYFRSGVEARIKEDQTPVTVADEEAEQTIRTLLLRRFPEHGLFGEESGTTDGDADQLWLVDPIDGTRSFVRGYPFFSTQIALRCDQRLTVGVSHAPLFEQTYWAEQGRGAWCSDGRLQVSGRQEIADSTLSVGNVGSLAKGARWAVLGELIPQFERVRGYGDFYHYHLLASGRIDAVIESDVNILDIAALTVIVREAGGVMTDLDGRSPDLTTTSVIAAASEALHSKLLEKFSAAR